MFSDCAWSIHFCRREPASTSHDGSTSNAVAYSARSSCGMRSMRASDAVEVLDVGDHHLVPQAERFRSRTRYSLTTVNSPDRFDFT
jgi:hypothetical protein